MKEEEFNRRYFSYETRSREEAERECAAVAAEAEGFVPVVQVFNFGDGRVLFCLMTESASAYLARAGIKTDAPPKE